MLLGILIGIVGTIIVILLYGAFSKPDLAEKMDDYWEESLDIQRDNSEIWQAILEELKEFNARTKTS